MKNKRAIESFGALTFNLNEIRKRVPQNVFESYEKTYKEKGQLSSEAAPFIAKAMKEWAIENDATHYCHWFQPMRGATAEKHDAFITYDNTGRVIEKFTEKELLQGEPDASSFPSGGMRSTFEARGYTAWDTGSFAFLRKTNHTTTLCIPSVFISYHGHALDEKTPLLRAMNVLSKAALRVLSLLGDTTTKRITTYTGVEQEYFLIDKDLYSKRMDLVMSNRTIIGEMPAKTQQLEDHYFGAISSRILDYMSDLERELYMLGIPVKTRHNEVAPRQFEVAMLYEETHIASDHNLMVMETLKRCAKKHDLEAVLHEKPFAGVNGSGKHNNWSIATDLGENLLEPSNAPQKNIRFLVFLVAVLKAFYKRSEPLLASISNVGNDHRLGANEAPPAIISVFLGDQLNNILDEIERGEFSEQSTLQKIELGLQQLPKVKKDHTDRNRTSPFAFTGNKFEFRAVPSSAIIAIPNMILNTVVSEALDNIAVMLESQFKKTKNKEQAVFEVLREEIKASKAIRFEGDNYSSAWKKEAKKRKLPETTNTPDAFNVWYNDKSLREVFTNYGVLNEAEITSRINVRLAQYKNSIEIEGKTLASIVRTQILPICIRYQTEVANSLVSIGGLTRKAKIKAVTLTQQQVFLKKYTELVSDLIVKTDALEKVIVNLKNKKSEREEAKYAATKIIPAMKTVRTVSDKLEHETPHDLWPFPTYFNLLFS